MCFISENCVMRLENFNRKREGLFSTSPCQSFWWKSIKPQSYHEFGARGRSNSAWGKKKEKEEKKLLLIFVAMLPS